MLELVEFFDNAILGALVVDNIFRLELVEFFDIAIFWQSTTYHYVSWSL